MSTRRQQQQFPLPEKTTIAVEIPTATSPRYKSDDAKLGVKHHHHELYDHTTKSSSPITALRLFITVFLWFISLLLFFSFFPTKSSPRTINPIPTTTNLITVPKSKCPDSILPFYIYTLPPEFNTALLTNCKSLNIYTNMCNYITNHGLGNPLPNTTSWFSTYQFIAEMLFHARTLSHPCRTHNPHQAKLFYIPFYAGLYASSTSITTTNLTARDSLANSLSSYLTSQPTWSRFHGHDHFIAIGRTAWDFMRPDDKQIPDYGANTLLNLPSIRNATVLTVERHPWQHRGTQFGIPYPSYFHPRHPSELRSWQDSILTQQKKSQHRRKYLFSFVGGTRPGLEKAKIRDHIITQCNQSTYCNLLDCSGSAKVGRCFDPSQVVKVMLDSEFCLQAPGDSFTRRSTFDSLLAGCVPVFFSVHTAYSQYEWYLPEKREEYSVFIDGESGREEAVRIEDVLRKIPRERIQEMRKKIVRKILPRVTYMHPDYVGDGSVFDAVDVALERMSRRVNKLVVDRSSPSIYSSF